MENARTDMEARLLQESKTEAERLLNSLKLYLERYNLTSAEHESIISIVKDLERELQGSDRAKIDDLREELNHKTETLAQKIMDGEIKKVLEGKKVDEI